MTAPTSNDVGFYETLILTENKTMLDEQKIRIRKSELLRHVEFCNKEIATRLSENEKDKDQIHDCEAKLKVIKEILED